MTHKDTLIIFAAIVTNKSDRVTLITDGFQSIGDTGSLLDAFDWFNSSLFLKN